MSASSRSEQPSLHVVSSPLRGHVVTDADGIIQEADEGAEVLLNKPRRWLEGRPLPAFVALPDRFRFRERLRELRARAGHLPPWRALLQPSGRMAVPSLVTAKPVFATERTLAVVHWQIDAWEAGHERAPGGAGDGAAEDLAAENRRLREELETLRGIEAECALARHGVEDALRSKSEFVANVSHEMRTPIHTILGNAELLSQGTLSADQRQLVHSLRRAADGLLDHITNVLDYSKSLGGELGLDQVAFDPGLLIDETVASLAARADRKRLELVSHVHPGLPSSLCGDPGRLRQILLNLIGNAIKFTERGEIVLEVESRNHGVGRSQLAFTVSDTGVGIPEERLGAVFAPFEQANGSPTRRFDGTGLGLSLAKRLIELMEGRITIDSEPGRGTRVRFTACLEDVAPSEDPSTFLRGRSVLVIDDGVTARLVAREILSECGASVVEAEGGAQALGEIARAAKEGRSFEWILLDCRMPGMGGFALIERLRYRPEILARMILLLPAHHRVGDVARARAFGLAGCLFKPVSRANLLDRLRPAAVTTTEPARILLVDDSSDAHALTELHLRGVDCRLDWARSGRAALKSFRAQRFDLVLLDPRTPLVEECDAVEAMREHERDGGGHTPMVVLTPAGASGRGEVERLCDGRLQKPLRRLDLLAALEKALRRENSVE